MKILIKIIQWYHRYLFLHSKDWQTRSKLVEADFERKLDSLAVKDGHYMVRSTLASCRIGQKIQLILAEDEHESVIRSLLWNEVLCDEVFQRIKERGFDLSKRLEIDKIKYGRFSSLDKQL